MAKTLEQLRADMQLAAQGSYDRNSMNVLDHVLYDNNLFQATTARPETSFYQQPVGTVYGAGTKGLTETNMELQGQIPNSQYFIAEEFSVAFVPIYAGTATTINTVVQAFINIVQSSTFRVVLAGRSFDLELPGSVFFPPVFSTALTSAANGLRVGEHTSSGWVRTKLPIVIEGGAAFNVRMTTRSAIAALQSILDAASNTLNAANAQIQFRMKGTLIRYM